MTKFNLEHDLLSVVVPVGKMAGQLNFLEAWLNEIDEYPIEVILVHDKTFSDVNLEFQRVLNGSESPKIKYIHGFFGNPGSARNAGLKLAHGHWIGFWDSDDVPNLRNVFTAIKMRNSDTKILIGQFTVLDINTNEFKATPNFEDNINSVVMNPGIWRMIFHADIIKNIQFPSLQMGEDQVFLSNIELANRNYEFFKLNFYQYNLGGISQLTKSSNALKDLPLASLMILNNAKKNHSKQTIFDLQLVLKQQITILRKTDFYSRLSIFRLFVAYFKKVDCFLFGQSLIALSRILRTIRNSRIS